MGRSASFMGGAQALHHVAARCHLSDFNRICHFQNELAHSLARVYRCLVYQSYDGSTFTSEPQ